MNLPSVAFGPIDPVLLPPDVAKLPRTAKRLAQLLLKGSSSPVSDAQKKWSLDFLLSPKAFHASGKTQDHLSSIAFQKMMLQGPNVHESNAKVLPTSEMSNLSASLAFRSIGYKSKALDDMEGLGIDFDQGRGIIPNDSQGRIISKTAEKTTLPGLYCSGWVKRGPAGVIANTMEDAFGTAEAITQDWAENKPFLAGREGWDRLRKEALQRGLRPVSWTDWQKIDTAEKERGKAKGKEREKFTSIDQMLSVLD